MIRLAAAALALAVSAPFALAATDAELSEQILGKWGPDAACSAGSLTFAADGTFVMVQTGYGETKGTWTIKDGILSGTREDGGNQPDARLAFSGDKVTMTETDQGREGELARCPE